MKDNVILFPGDAAAEARKPDLILVNERGEEIGFDVLDTMDYQGQRYAALHPCGGEAGEVAVFREEITREGTGYDDRFDEDLKDEVFQCFVERWKAEDDTVLPDDIVILTDERGNAVPVRLVDEIECGGRQYAVMLSNNPGDDEVIIMAVERQEEDVMELEELENEDEIQAVYRIFKERNRDKFDFAD